MRAPLSVWRIALAKSIYTGLAAGVLLAAQNIVFLAMGWAFYLVHGEAYLARFVPFNPLFSDERLLYVDQPVFAGGPISAVIIIVFTVASAMAWGVIMSRMAPPPRSRWRAGFGAATVVACTWAVPILLRRQPDSLVAPLVDSLSGLLWIALPYALMAASLGRAVAISRSKAWLVGLTTLWIAIAVFTPIFDSGSRIVFSGTTMDRLLSPFDGPTAPLDGQALNHHYWRCASWTLSLIAWSIALCVAIVTLQVRAGTQITEGPENVMWRFSFDRTADALVALALAFALYMAYVYQVKPTGWAIAWSAALPLLIRPWIRRVTTHTRRRARGLAGIRVGIAWTIAFVAGGGSKMKGYDYAETTDLMLLTVGMLLAFGITLISVAGAILGEVMSAIRRRRRDTERAPA